MTVIKTFFIFTVIQTHNYIDTTVITVQYIPLPRHCIMITSKPTVSHKANPTTKATECTRK